MKTLTILSLMICLFSIGPQAEAASLQRLSHVGAVFTLDNSHPALGEAYRDPQGLLWGDIAINKDGTVHPMTQYEAQDYCASITGAHLPTKEEFRQLSLNLGFKNAQGYSPYLEDGKTQILPDLVGHWFWSSSIFPFNSDNAYAFSGDYGYNDQMSFTGYVFRESYNGAVRCVIQL